MHWLARQHHQTRCGSHGRKWNLIGDLSCQSAAADVLHLQEACRGGNLDSIDSKTSNSQPTIRTHHEPPILQAKANGQAPIEQEVQPLMINPVNHMHCPERVFLNCPESTLINYVMSV